MTAPRSSSSLSSTDGTTALSTSSSAVPLLPDYTFLSHFIYHNLTKANRSSASTSSSSSTPLSHPPLSLSLDVSGIVASFLWFPIRTSTFNSLHSRTRWLHNDPTLSHCTGEVHADTIQHDGWTAELHTRILRGWRLRAIHGWGGMFANGLGFSYCHPSDPSETFEVEAVYGNHNNPQLSHFELEAGERIVQVSMICSTWLQAVRFDTSHGREYQIGRAEHRHYWQPLLPTADKLHGKQVEALAFMIGVGGHIHNLGVWYQLVSPPATERVYESAETLVAVMSRPDVVSHVAAAEAAMDVSSAAAGAVQPGFWARGFQLGRVGGRTRQHPRQIPTTDEQQQEQE